MARYPYAEGCGEFSEPCTPQGALQSDTILISLLASARARAHMCRITHHMCDGYEHRLRGD